VGKPIEQRRRHLGVAKDVAPFSERQVRGHDQRDAFVVTCSPILVPVEGS